MRDPEGEHWLEARGRAVFDDHGVPLRILGTSADISVRKEAELAREALLAEFREQVAAGRELVGILFFSAFPHLADRLGPLMAKALANGRAAVARNVLFRLDTGVGVADQRYFDFVVQLVHGRYGKVDSLLIIGLEVTHFVETQQVLQRLPHNKRSWPSSSAS